MPAPILHIGYHKTGTSWFQKNFFPHVRGATYLDRRLVRDVFFNTTAFLFDAKRAAQRLACKGRPIVSEEDFSGFPDNSGCLEALSKDIAYRLHAVYPDARIVIFIRNQLEMLRANYLQYARGGGARSLEQYLFPYDHEPHFAKRQHHKPLFTLEHFAYQHLIRHYRSVFGKDRVHVFLYEDFAAAPQAFARAFAERFALDVPLDRLSYTRRNESLDTGALKLARALGPFTTGTTRDRRLILPLVPHWAHKAGMKVLNKTPLAGRRVTTSELFGNELLIRLHNHYAAENRELAREIDIDLKARGYPVAPIET